MTKQDVLGKWSLFFFYPADFTFVCPTELEDLQNKYAEFKAAGCEVYSVSTDTHFVHKAWHDHSERISKITYPMLADPTHALSRDFEVYIEENGLAERGSFIVNPEGKIVVYEVNAGNVGRNADELLRRLQASQHRGALLDHHSLKVAFHLPASLPVFCYCPLRRDAYAEDVVRII